MNMPDSRPPVRHPSSDDLIDQLLAGQPVAARPEFNAKLRHQLAVDALLAAQPVAASPDFAARVRQRLLFDQHRAFTRARRTVHWLHAAAAIAAVAALSVVGLYLVDPQPAAAPAVASAVPATLPDLDPQLTELLALANNLRGTSNLASLPSGFQASLALLGE
jgi:hypothetical protein